MTTSGVLQLILYIVVLLVLAKPLGSYMALVYEGRPVGLDRVLGWLERLIYRLSGVRPGEEMGWKTYAATMLVFNLAGLLVVYLLQRLQGVLPLNPQGLGTVSPDSSFNTAVSFASNTNWQGYGGETTMSYLTQMLGMTVQNFVSAATGMAVLAAFIRGFARRSSATIGNFWVDLTRTTLYILLPLSFVLALILVSQGVVQTFGSYAKVTVVQPTEYNESITDKDGKPVLDEKGQPKTKKATLTEQVLAVGPAASQIAIKQLGTNGGGFFNVNSSHPFENATPLSNFLQLLAILVISAALCYMFGVMVGDTRQGWAILAAMTVMFVGLLAVCVVAEQNGHTLVQQGVDHTASALQAGGNMEGKEVRFGIATSALWATATTAASNGSVNAMHDSFTPIGGLVPMWLMQLGVADGAQVLGVIQLKDIVKGGIKERFGELRRMGIRTVMITGDNPLTAAAIAAEAGVDDFLAQATPEAKLRLIRDMQVDLDSNPTKLLEVVETGKQMLMTRGALTTFSIANDVAKYFAIIPAAFASTYPVLDALNVMRLATHQSAILSAVIFNALIIIALIPLALKGVRYRPLGAAAVLRRHVWVYGIGGIIIPFPGIKLIDMILVALGLV